MRNIALTFAELEREMVAERTRDKMTAMVRQGRWPGGNLALGYDVLDGKLIPNEREASIVRLMFETYLETKCLGAVRDRLIALGAQTKRPKFRNATKDVVSEWSRQKVDYILRNRVYLGELNYDGIRVEGTHPAIVDADVFDLVQGLFADGFRHPRIDSPHGYYLVGKIYCGDCGCRLVPRSTNHPRRKKGYTPYYECYRTGRYRGIDCDIRRMNADIIEEMFCDTVAKLAEDRTLIEGAAAQACMTDENTEQIEVEEKALVQRGKEVEVKLGNVMSAIEQGLASTSVQTRLAELENVLATIKAQLNIVRTRLKEAKPDSVDAEAAQQVFAEFATVFPGCTEEEKEHLVDFILKKAVVQKDKTVEFEFYAREDGADVVQYVKVELPGVDSNHEPPG